MVTAIIRLHSRNEQGKLRWLCQLRGGATTLLTASELVAATRA